MDEADFRQRGSEIHPQTETVRHCRVQVGLPDKEEEEEPDVGSVPPGVIQKMIQALPEGYRTVLNLYAFEEKSHKEIAALLGITESTSASQLHRARAILARQINEYKKRTETT